MNHYLAKAVVPPPPPDPIKVHLPDLRQHADYTCGASAMQSICEYFGVGPETEDEFMSLLGSDPEEGTNPRRILALGEQLGLQVRAGNGWSIEDLTAELEQENPVLVLIQAWGDPVEEEANYPRYDDGHYVVVVGYDDQYIYVEDPSLKGVRGTIPHRDFLERWHDEGGDGARYERWGAVFSKEHEYEPVKGLKGSYFAECERDDEGHCLPSGQQGAEEPEEPEEGKRPSVDANKIKQRLQKIETEIRAALRAGDNDKRQELIKERAQLRRQLEGKEEPKSEKPEQESKPEEAKPVYPGIVGMEGSPGPQEVADARKEEREREKEEAKQEVRQESPPALGSEKHEARMRELEGIIQNSKHEIFYGVDQNGQVRTRYPGRGDRVRFSREDLRNLKDGVLIHNHPESTSFSPTDIEMAIRNGVSETRVIGRDGSRYRMIIDPSVRGDVELASKAGRVQPDRQTGYFHDSWEQFAQESDGKITYIREGKSEQVNEPRENPPPQVKPSPFRKRQKDLSAYSETAGGALVPPAEQKADSSALERAKRVDLITLPEGITGTNCFNCKYIKDSYCVHPEVDQPVTERMCCALWDAEGTKRAWEKAGEKGIKGSYFGECERIPAGQENAGACKPSGEADNTGGTGESPGEEGKKPEEKPHEESPVPKKRKTPRIKPSPFRDRGNKPEGDTTLKTENAAAPVRRVKNQYGVEVYPVELRRDNSLPGVSFEFRPDGHLVISAPNWADVGYIKRRLIRAWDRFVSPLPENHYVRVTNRAEDYRHLKEGTHRGSWNHRDDVAEDGLSVSKRPEFTAKYVYIVQGQEIGEGTDGEPLLDIETARPVSELMEYRKWRPKFDKQAEKHVIAQGWTMEQANSVYAVPQLFSPEEFQALRSSWEKPEGQ